LQRADRIDRPLRPKWRSLSAQARNLAAQYGAFTAKMKRKLDAARRRLVVYPCNRMSAAATAVRKAARSLRMMFHISSVSIAS
jgi:hypothetical protein